MFDGRIAVVIVAVLFLWALNIPSHANPIVGRSMKLGRLLSMLGGSTTGYVSVHAFALQLGYLSILLWYVGLVRWGAAYLRDNAFVFALFLGVITGLSIHRILRP